MAELPQWLKKQQATQARRWRGDQPRAVEGHFLKSTALNLSLTSRHPVKKGEVPLQCGETLGATRLGVSRFSNTLGKRA